MNQIESTELINLVFSIAFFIVLQNMLYNRKYVIPVPLIIGTSFILFGNVFTVVESVVFPVLFNILEHLSFTVGTGFFFAVALKTYRTS